MVTAKDFELLGLKPDAPYWAIKGAINYWELDRKSDTPEEVEEAIYNFNSLIKSSSRTFESTYPHKEIDLTSVESALFVLDGVDIKLIGRVKYNLRDNTAIEADVFPKINKLCEDRYDVINYPEDAIDEKLAKIYVRVGLNFKAVKRFIKSLKGLKDFPFTDEQLQIMDYFNDEQNYLNALKESGFTDTPLYFYDHTVNPYKSIWVTEDIPMELVPYMRRALGMVFVNLGAYHPLGTQFEIRINDAMAILTDPAERAKVDSRLGLTKVKKSQGGMIKSSVFEDLAVKKRNPNARDGQDVKIDLSLPLESILNSQTVKVKYTTKSFCTSCLTKGKVIPDDAPVCPGCNNTKITKRPVTSSITGELVTTQEIKCGLCKDWPPLEQECEKCDGHGYSLNFIEYDLNLPAGIEPGRPYIKFGEGNPGFLGGKDGDLHVSIKLEHKPSIKVIDTDVYLAQTVKYSHLCKGVDLVVEPLGEQHHLTLPPKTHPGETFEIEGGGIPNMSTGVRGKLIVEIKVKMANLTPKHIEIFDKMNL